MNLKQEAVRLTVPVRRGGLACGLDSADTARVKQEEKAGSC
jgi:putative transposase